MTDKRTDGGTNGRTDGRTDRRVHSSKCNTQYTIETKNKAVYTTASVAYGWAGALMRFR